MRAGLALWALALSGVWVRYPASMFGVGLTAVCVCAGLLALALTLGNLVLCFRVPEHRVRRVVTIAASLVVALPWLAWFSLSAGDVLRSAF